MSSEKPVLFTKEPRVLATYQRDNGAYGLTSEQVAEALKMHGEFHEKKIIDEVAEEYGFTEHMNDGLRKLFGVMIGRAISVGMELCAEPRSLADWYMEQKAIKGADLTTTYEFEEGMGVSGLLKPDGTFLKCASTEHNLLVQDYTLEEQFTFIYFSGVRRWKGKADPDEDGDGIITVSPKFAISNLEFAGASEAQLQWLKDNFKYFDRGQKRSAWVRWDIGEDEDL